MKKITVFAALLSLLTLAVFSGCSSSSSDNGGGIVIPPASDSKVGLYTIEKIVSVSGVTAPFDTSRPEQVLYFNGEMVVANNTLKIDGKYQVVGYSEYINRPSTPAGKYITYNRFSADDKRYTVRVTDTSDANIVLDLTVVQKDNNPVAAINYQPWTKPPVDSQNPGGNPYWSNFGFNAINGGSLVPTNLIGNYMIKEVVIDKNGVVATVNNTTSAKDLVGELSVTARLGGADQVFLNIAIKLQTNPANTTGTSFATFVFNDQISDTIPLDFDLKYLNSKLPEIFANEGMTIVSGSDTDIKYSPKKRNQDNTFSDLKIDGATVTFTLSKIINGGINKTQPEKVLTNTKYWVE